MKKIKKAIYDSGSSQCGADASGTGYGSGGSQCEI